MFILIGFNKLVRQQVFTIRRQLYTENRHTRKTEDQNGWINLDVVGACVRAKQVTKCFQSQIFSNREKNYWQEQNEETVHFCNPHSTGIDAIRFVYNRQLSTQWN